MLIFLTCKNSNNTIRNSSDCDKLLMGKNVTEKSVALYKINHIFQNYLDTIIANEEKCTYYNKCSSGFSFIIQQSAEEDYSIEINSTNIYTHDYTNSIGVFKYGDYLFICEGLNNKEILNSTMLNTRIKFLNIDRSQSEITHDDRFSTWYFGLNNNLLQLKGHHPCPSGNNQ